MTIDTASADPTAGLRTKVASGVRWGIIISVVSQVARILFLVALMRLLGPRSVGIVGQATLVVAIAQMFVHFGLAVSIVQRPILDQSEVGTAFWLNVALGVLLAVSMVVGAPLLSDFFKTEELTAIFRVLSLALILKALTIVPTALRTRHMQFRSLAAIEIASTFASGALGVGSALMGADYWSLVIQALSYEGIYLLLILYVGGLPDFSWSSAAARRLWSMSSRVMGADLMHYVSDQSDKFFIARFLGATSLGLYSLAFRVLQLTLAMLTHVGRVILPAFARLQDDRERLGRAFLNVIESVALVICPAMTLTILLAPVAVPLIFGEAWSDGVVPLQLIAAMTIQYVLGGFMGPLKIAVGRADWEFRWAVVTMVVSLVVFPIGLNWGIEGVAMSYLIMFSVMNPIRFMVIQRLVPISARSCLRALAPAATGSLVLAGTWLLTEALLDSVASELVYATAASFAGAAAFLLTLKVAWPTDLRRQFEFARLVLGGNRT